MVWMVEDVMYQMLNFEEIDVKATLKLFLQVFFVVVHFLLGIIICFK